MAAAASLLHSTALAPFAVANDVLVSWLIVQSPDPAEELPLGMGAGDRGEEGDS